MIKMVVYINICHCFYASRQLFCEYTILSKWMHHGLCHYSKYLNADIITLLKWLGVNMLQHIIMNACGQNTQIYIVTLIYLSIIVHVCMHGCRRHNNRLYVARELSLCSRLIDYLLLLMLLSLMHDSCMVVIFAHT